jgi:hypothetical protein
MGIKKTFKKDDLPKVEPMFKGNVGKTGIIFNKHHPYFSELPKELKGLQEVNFGLPINSFNNG